MKINLLKKTILIDKTKNKLRTLMGYKEGKRFICETEPYIKKYSDIELDKIANIEQKLEKVLEENEKAGALVEGISEKEARLLIEWVVQRVREIFNKEKDIKDNDLWGYCSVSQALVSTLLVNMKLKPGISNVNQTIIGEELEGIHHAFNSVAIPVKDENGIIRDLNYIIDITYRQFFLRDGWSTSGRFVKDKRFGNKVAPIAGYWCINLPNGKEFAERILRDGFIEMTPENAKIYGDSFILEKRKNNKYEKIYQMGITVPARTTKRINTGISGEQYIQKLTDKTRQEDKRIDYNGNKLDEYRKLMQTPLMRKRELKKNTNDYLKDDNENDIYKEGKNVDLEQ